MPRSAPRLLAAVVSATVLVTSGCAGDSRTVANPSRSGRGQAATSAGIGVDRPRGWHLLTRHITALAYPTERMLLTSYPTRRGGNCGPDRAERDLPADGALIYLFEYRPRVGAVWTGGLRRSNFPRRPAHFSLRNRDLGHYECWQVPSYLIRFRAADRPFQLHVALGPRAGAARRADVLRALDSLRFAALPPPPPDPYAGWHALHDETGDTLRTPPGWAAAVTPSPRRRAQPRTLFYTANRPIAGWPDRGATTALALPTTLGPRALAVFPKDGVLLWIREDTPGPATTDWPRLPARQWPRAQDFVAVADGLARRWPQLRWVRAAAQQRNTRYSIWIVSGPGATRADRELATKSAARFAFSVGSFRNRPCRRTCESGTPVRVITAAAPGDRLTARTLHLT